ncbi:MAG: serine O-acetyltransferase [Gammaproteobacteria bacterium]|nr:serine O-acetyltransferase [Gammaproteobacteria bacterium]MBT8150669.1 serine O-acetyltransferase [Gammaproteobacteria bacterium]NND39706.1 serine O-acetyltransferase [Pseudomonadales bacterium]NNL10302.1 serine O-acetyltransferase [Pseudomonadales bacterium]NNM12617.1 serine O-acetyltransferase [Pseudomonadales bacterium]
MKASTPTDSLIDEIWDCIRREAEREAAHEPILASHLHATVLNHDKFSDALAYHLSNLLGSGTASALSLMEVITDTHVAAPAIVESAAYDVAAIRDRDSACNECGTPFLYYKGFHALQTHRVAHQLWRADRRELALFLQSISSSCFSVDIHPAARIGRGIMFDHANGIVIGETSEVGDNVSIMQSVTLGGTGKAGGDRHPKVGAGVLIGAGSKVLGNIRIGEGAKIGAGSVVLKDVPAHTIAAGVPAEIVGKLGDAAPALSMDQRLTPGKG